MVFKNITSWRDFVSNLLKQLKNDQQIHYTFENWEAWAKKTSRIDRSTLIVQESQNEGNNWNTIEMLLKFTTKMAAILFSHTMVALSQIEISLEFPVKEICESIFLP